MKDFTSSDGVNVFVEEYVTDKGPAVWVDGHRLSPLDTSALREFFRAEEDERLGRWRCPENPDYVVYPLGLDLNGMRYAQAMYELTGNSGRWQEGQSSIPAPTSPERLGILAVAAYFDAHPEPKPAWYDAQPGEVWVLEVEDETPGVPWLVKQTSGISHSYFARPEAPPSALTYGVRCAQITAGHRIWPEGTS